MPGILTRILCALGICVLMYLLALFAGATGRSLGRGDGVGMSLGTAAAAVCLFLICLLAEVARRIAE